MSQHHWLSFLREHAKEPSLFSASLRLGTARIIRAASKKGWPSSKSCQFNEVPIDSKEQFKWILSYGCCECHQRLGNPDNVTKSFNPVTIPYILEIQDLAALSA